MSSVIESLLAFVNQELLAGSGKVAADTPLFEGHIDSLKILKLIAFVELQRGRRIADEEIVMHRFRTVETIVRNFLPPMEAKAE